VSPELPLPPAGNNESLRRNNLSVVLECIRQNGPISRADITRLTGLNFTTVTSIIESLRESGLVADVGYGDSSGGRRPLLLHLNPHGRFAVGCEIQATLVRVGLVNLLGETIAVRSWALTAGDEPDEVVKQIAAAIKELQTERNLQYSQLAGIGVAAPGPLDTRSGTFGNPPNLPRWRGYRLKEQLEAASGLQVVLEKDGNAGALGETWYGNAQTGNTVLFIIADVGIGAGLILHRRLHRGLLDGAGEFGHMVIDIDGPECSCGNHGCLEAIASGFALSREAGHELRRGVHSKLTELDWSDPDQLVAALPGLGHSDGLAAQLLSHCGRHVGIALANMINVLSPDTIVIGGRLGQSNHVADELERLARERSFLGAASELKVVNTAFPDASLVTGAASLVLAQILQAPVELGDERNGLHAG